MTPRERAEKILEAVKECPNPEGFIEGDFHLLLHFESQIIEAENAIWRKAMEIAEQDYGGDGRNNTCMDYHCACSNIIASRLRDRDWETKCSNK